MEQKEINSLVEKIARQQATEEDRNKLSQWLHTLDDQSLQDFMDQYQEILILHKGARKDHKLRALIEHRISDYERSNNFKKGKKPYPFLSILSKVAIFIFILVLGYGIKEFVKDTGRVEGQVDVSGIPSNSLEGLKTIKPGDKRAVIISETGAEKDLNSLQVGQWVDFDGVKIRKTSDGILEYGRSSSSSMGNLQHTLKTPKGGEFNVVLSDGTSVWLNSSSSISFPNRFNGRSRDVDITGEVYFEVTKKKSESHINVPFIVHSKNQRIEVLGTQFSVSAYPESEEMETTLVEGSVKVSTDKEIKLMEPGEQVAVSRNGNIRTVSNADVEKSIAWTNGYFYFDNKGVSDVFHELERWYNVEFELANDLPYGGFGGRVSRTKNLQEVLRLLEITELVKFEVNGDKIVVRKGF